MLSAIVYAQFIKLRILGCYKNWSYNIYVPIKISDPDFRYQLYPADCDFGHTPPRMGNLIYYFFRVHGSELDVVIRPCDGERARFGDAKGNPSV